MSNDTSLTNEQWRDIPGYEGLYQASDHGRVKSVDREIYRQGYGTYFRKGKIRSSSLSTGGYPQLRLSANGKLKMWGIHVLVCAAFFGPRPEGMQVRHLDGNQQNNHISNLAYGTPSENNRDKLRHGTCHESKKTHCPRGHRHSKQNNVAACEKIGTRSCLACNRARRHISRHPELKGRMQEVADSYYAKIME